MARFSRTTVWLFFASALTTLMSAAVTAQAGRGGAPPGADAPERPDYLTFAQGAVPVSIGGAAARGRSSAPTSRPRFASPMATRLRSRLPIVRPRRRTPSLCIPCRPRQHSIGLPCRTSARRPVRPRHSPGWWRCTARARVRPTASCCSRRRRFRRTRHEGR